MDISHTLCMKQGLRHYGNGAGGFEPGDAEGNISFFVDFYNDM